MAAAVYFVWSGGGPARRHGGWPPAAGGLTRLGADLDRELRRLAGTLDPLARARLLGSLQDAGWSAASLAHIGARLDRLGRPQPERSAERRAEAARAATDSPGGPETAARLAARSFPVPARRVLTDRPGPTAGRGLAPRVTRRRSR
jgi:hypothetical protein